MKAFVFLLIVLALLASFYAGVLFSRDDSKRTNIVFRSDTLTITRIKTDTLIKTKNVPKFVKTLDTLRLKDTIMIKERKVYEDSDYKAVISGSGISLDSLKVYPKTIIRTKVIRKKQRWGFGVQTGIGMTKKGLLPYIGVGFFWKL